MRHEKPLAQTVLVPSLLSPVQVFARRQWTPGKLAEAEQGYDSAWKLYVEFVMGPSWGERTKCEVVGGRKEEFCAPVVF